MAKANWKARERQVAAALGGSRTGPSGLNTNDITHPSLAVEVKARKVLPKWAVECLHQARTARGASGKLPCVVMVALGQNIKDALVVMRLGEFEEWYGSFVDPTRDGEP